MYYLRQLLAMSDTDQNSVDVHPIFLTDPEQLLSYVYKEICVARNDGETHTGRCYTVDPVSQSVVLVRFDDNNTYKLKVIMGHCVQKITVLDEDTEKYKSRLDDLFKYKAVADITPEKRRKLRNKLKGWLLKNRIPIEETGENGEILSLSDALTIQPPYGPDDCCSTNEIILGKVQGLIKSMPTDVDEW